MKKILQSVRVMVHAVHEDSVEINQPYWEDTGHPELLTIPMSEVREQDRDRLATAMRVEWRALMDDQGKIAYELAVVE